jgi:MoxR-like ATPase
VTNPFEAMAERQMNGAQKSRERRVERAEAKRSGNQKPAWLEKKQHDDAVLAKMYRAWRRGIRDEIVRVHGRDFAALLRVIRALEWTRADRVVEHVHDAWWLRRADADTRLATLHYIDESLCRARIRYGLQATFDDGLPGEPPSPFIKIRRLLFDV